VVIQSEIVSVSLVDTPVDWWNRIVPGGYVRPSVHQWNRSAVVGCTLLFWVPLFFTCL